MMRKCAHALLLFAYACGDDAHVGAASPGHVEIAASVKHRMRGMYGIEPPLEGVRVCVDGSVPRNCATTGEDGSFRLAGLTPGDDVLFVYQKEGFYSELQPLVAPRWSTGFGTGEVRLAPRDNLQNFADDFNRLLLDAGLPALEPDLDANGMVVFGAWEEGMGPVARGYTAALDPPSGRGPFFLLLQTEEPVLDVPAGATAVAGVFYDVAPGKYELVYTQEGGSCRYAPGPNSGWPPDSGRPNAAGIEVRAGHETWWTMQHCTTDDAGVGDGDPDAGAPDASRDAGP